MRESRFDIHGLLGIAGMISSGLLSNWSPIMGGIAATFTAGYMGLRFFRELRKFRRDSVTITVPKNPTPTNEK